MEAADIKMTLLSEYGGTSYGVLLLLPIFIVLLVFLICLPSLPRSRSPNFVTGGKGAEVRFLGAVHRHLTPLPLVH